MIDILIQKGVLHTPKILEAFRAIDRKKFIPEDMEDLAYLDEALPIGFGQTISQPYTVVFMLELLMPESGNNILEIGYGSGWQTSLLAHIVSEGGNTSKGRVYAVELVKELCKLGKNNISKFNFIKSGIVKCFCQNAEGGLPDVADEIGGFDRIIAATSVYYGSPTSVIDSVPTAWRSQLKSGGRIVIPIDSSIWLFIKNEDGSFEEKEHPGFVFVPFVPENKERTK